MGRVTICAVAALTTWPSAHLAGQTIPWPRADRLTITVRATVTLLTGDTIRVSHTVRNNRSSKQSMELFIVVTASTFTAKYGGPSTSPYWYIGTGNLQDTAAISWFATDSSAMVAPGDSAVGFNHRAVGEADIVSYYAVGYVEPPEVDDAKEDNIGHPLPIWRDSFKGYTIAVVPFPTEMTAAAMATRLAALVQQACARRFVSDAALCRNDRSRPRLALSAALANDIASACTQFDLLLQDVSRMRGSAVTPEGKALLSIRTQQFRSRYCR